MRPRIVHIPPPQRRRMTRRYRRVPFAPLSQEPTSPLVGIGKQILDYLQFGKPIATPLKPIKTEIIIPPETKKFIRNTIFMAAGAVVGGIVLYQALK